ncbi:benzoate 1,2-dioxygenase electron transfer component BenC [Paraburkholderia youngii]|uniref:Cytochrome P450/NAD(P)H-flavin reductase n=1 Tax=Paraburkholderia youngii TaxID=2782701 RepID=A0A7W8P1N9_9BURK|nr:benzoate 1,2-dioxygenase electron transfer component BenC [Paraburkholderia youngii]MBB5398173.1 cytochrome P450/NAD(P)H-flavin reductase [Paraburkholderia youngii]
MVYQITLNFEDGVTRLIDCEDGERIADAAIRAKLNIPLDCRDGVCGTCKAVCESGEYTTGDCTDEAISAEELAQRKVLTCQMSPKSDCVIQIASSSTGKSARMHQGRLTSIERVSESTIAFAAKLEDRVGLEFKAGQYVNVTVPGTDQTRSYSFSSGPQDRDVSFLVRNVPQGLMSTWLADKAKVGAALEFKGPYGGFYLREIGRPVLMLAGGTGLAPFLSMLDEVLKSGGSKYPIHLILGVNTDNDLVCVDQLERYAKLIPGFTYATVIADKTSAHPRKGWVTDHIEAAQLNDGEVDIYLCGPPAMVDAVSKYLKDQNVNPTSFHYEKFATAAPAQAAAPAAASVVVSQAVDAPVSTSDAARALELGLLLGRLNADQIQKFGAFAAAQKALVQATGDDQLVKLYTEFAQDDFVMKALAKHVKRDSGAMSALAEEAKAGGCPFHAMIDQAPATALPPYSHELKWPEGMEPFKVVDDGSQGDPYAHYEWMRENAPVLRCQSTTSDVWFISRYEDVFKAVRNTKLFSSEVVKPVPLTFLTLFDGEAHSRLRTILQPSFTPLAIDPFVEAVTARANELLDAMIAKGGGDVVQDFSIPLSIRTISAMLDVPAEDEEKMKFWSDETFSYFGRIARNALGTGTDEQSANDFWEYLRVQMLKLMDTDSQSIGAHIARMWKDGLLSEKEAKELCSFVFIAGHDTTTILVANAFRMMAEQPHHLERLRANMDDCDKFVEETARYRGTVQRVSRVTTADTTVAGVHIPKGSIIRLLLSSANRDSRKFPDGETFNIDRDNEAHMGFGNGMHKCLGMPLAKLETLLSVRALAQKVGSISLDATKEIKYVRGNNLTNSGPEHLFVKLTGR